MRDVTAARLADALHAIDQANAADPNQHEDEPLALAQGRRASAWLESLDAAPTTELALAVRAHHLRRWEIARSDYPEGRAGYLRWRRDNKRHQAESLADIMQEQGFDRASIDRARDLLSRTALANDPETQTLEDVACLVFLETQFDALIKRFEHEHMVQVVAKTLRKMSGDAIELAGAIPVSHGGERVLADAINHLRESES